MMKAYAGIGSRKAPSHIQMIMQHLGAYLCDAGWTLRSGAAAGADQAFEAGVDITVEHNDYPHNTKEIYLPWRNYNHSNSLLNPFELPFTSEEMEFTSNYHPAWNKCSTSVKLMHARNSRIILGHESVNGPEVTPVKFVVCWTPSGQAQGGTGQAIRIAQALSIPIFNLGVATNPAELEGLVLEIDRIQGTF